MAQEMALEMAVSVKGAVLPSSTLAIVPYSDTEQTGLERLGVTAMANKQNSSSRHANSQPMHTLELQLEEIRSVATVMAHRHSSVVWILVKALPYLLRHYTKRMVKITYASH